MKNIGLIDDKNKSRRAFMLKLQLKLEETNSEWKIIDIKPFKDTEDYRQWILENSISVLLIDERLDEERLDDGSYVGYFGSDLVKELRTYLKDFPIFCITNIEITEKLKNAFGYFNLTLSRRNFDDDINNYLNLLIKSGTSFYTEFKKELGRVGELSEKIAKGDANANDRNEIQSLQTKLLIPHLTDDLMSRESYIAELEKKIEQIKSMQNTLIQLLKK